MNASPTPDETAPDRPSSDRLDSWKEIAAYLRRDVTTVQRWEKREGMPVHRHVHDKLGSIHAFRSELDRWTRSRQGRPDAAPDADAGRLPASGEGTETAAAEPPIDAGAQVAAVAPEMTLAARRGTRAPIVVAAVIAGVTAFAGWRIVTGPAADSNPLADARFLQLTDFDGSEQAAAISRDGQFVAFLSDRDGAMDVWVTQMGSGQFYNLTRGRMPELVNPSVRTLGFSPDGSSVTLWARRPNGSEQPSIDVWAVPVLGGAPRPYLDGAAEFDWSPDGARLVYHTSGPGDPMFVRGREQADGTMIAVAPAGLHRHFPTWSPDQRFVYFVQGTPPDRSDIWRMRADGSSPERVTHHDALVSHPVFLDDDTMMYLAAETDGSGPWLHALAVRTGRSRRLAFGLDRYTSLAASADGMRLVATVARRRGTLWSLPVADSPAALTAARPIPLTTSSGSSPRVGPGFLLYVSAKPTGDSLWKLQGETATELWNAAETEILGGPAISRDGQRIAFSTRRHGTTALYVANSDGTDARVLTGALALSGPPVFAPGGDALAVSALDAGTPCVYRVPLDGSAPTVLVGGHAADPAWSPAGTLLVFSGPDVGTTFPVRAVDQQGHPLRLPHVALTRGARHMAFDGERSLVVLRGGIRHKNLWAIDLDSGRERQLTDFPRDFYVRDFDISADGRELVVEQEREHSDILLIERSRR
jgi:Tol biopolymer transport system component